MTDSLGIYEVVCVSASCAENVNDSDKTGFSENNRTHRGQGQKFMFVKVLPATLKRFNDGIHPEKTIIVPTLTTESSRLIKINQFDYYQCKGTFGLLIAP